MDASHQVLIEKALRITAKIEDRATIVDLVTAFILASSKIDSQAKTIRELRDYLVNGTCQSVETR